MPRTILHARCEAQLLDGPFEATERHKREGATDVRRHVDVQRRRLRGRRAKGAAGGQERYQLGERRKRGLGDVALVGDRNGLSGTRVTRQPERDTSAGA